MANADRIIELLHEARLRPAGAERDRFLAEACAGDSALMDQVVSLLEAEAADNGSFLRMSPVVRPALLPSEKPGDRIGRYKLLEQIGEGGCGVVYMAEQEEPVRRRVALKVIKLGMDTKSVIARFEAERQALALMDHPNIAKVFDAGATDTGRPYFVMELVRGIRITDFCDQHHLSTNERLELFIQVCHAIQHAHQKGIIHRDIKPSNILVTVSEAGAVGCPKVIDFGIAKATNDQRLTDKTVFTAFEQFIGTPAYMSPEQAMMTSWDIDTRTDIYALGVLLYELLTGSTPFDAKALLAAGMDEMRRKIRDEEPATPSTCLSTMQALDLTAVARRRQVEPPRLIHLVRGDLDWLVMKCLEKDRTRRYETANGLAADVRRHLGNEPITARPPSRWYEFQKTVRRHRFGFAVAAALILVLGLGVVTSGWQAIRATRAERQQSQLRKEADAGRETAQTEAAKSRQVAQFMQDMLKGVGPSVALGRDTKMLREILDRTALRLDELKDQPSVQVSLQLTLARVYADLAEYEAAIRMCRSAVELQRKLSGAEHPDLAGAMHQLAGVLFQQGGHAEAEALFHEVVAMRRKLLGVDHPAVADSLHELSMLYRETGNLAKAENTAREVVAIRRARFGETDRQVAVAQQLLAWNLKLRDRFSEAEAVIRQSIATRKALLGNEHSEVIFALFDLAEFLHDQGKRSESDAVTNEVLAMRGRLFESKSPFAAQCLQQLAWVLHVQGRHADAEMVSREALGIRHQVLGRSHPDVAHNLSFLGLFLRAQGKLAEAEAVLREALTIHREALGIGHFTTMHSVRAVTDLLLSMNRSAEAEKLQRDELAACREVHGSDHPATAVLLHELAMLLRNQGRLTEAESLAREALLIRRRKLGDQHLDVASTLHLLAWTRHLQRNDAEAETLSREAVAILRARLGNDHQHVAWTLYDLAVFLRDQGKLTEAETTARESSAIRRKVGGNAHPDVGATVSLLAAVLKRGGKRVEAEAVWREELASRRKETGGGGLAVATACHELAELLREQQKPAEAETLIRDALSIRRSLLGEGHPRLADSWRVLGELLADQGKAKELAALLEESPGAAGSATEADQAQFGRLLWLMGNVWLQAGQFGDAGRAFGRALQKFRQLQTQFPSNAHHRQEQAFSLRLLAEASRRAGGMAAAESNLRMALGIYRQLMTEVPSSTFYPWEVARTLERLTYLLRDQSRLSEAEATAREVFALHQKRSGDTHPETAEALKNVAEVLHGQGRYAEAKSTFLEAASHASAPTLNEIAFTLATAASAELRDGPVALTFAEKAVAATSRSNSMMVDTLAAAYAEVGQFTKAVRVQQEAIDLLQDEALKQGLRFRLKLYTSGLRYRNPGQLARLATALLDAGKHVEAERPARECLALREQLIPDDWRTFNARSILGGSLLGQSKYAEAEPLLLSGYEGMKQREGRIPADGRPRLKEALQRLVRLHEATARPEKAAAWRKTLSEFVETEGGKETAVPKP